MVQDMGHGIEVKLEIAKRDYEKVVNSQREKLADSQCDILWTWRMNEWINGRRIRNSDMSWTIKEGDDSIDNIVAFIYLDRDAEISGVFQLILRENQ